MSVLGGAIILYHMMTLMVFLEGLLHKVGGGHGKEPTNEIVEAGRQPWRTSQ